MAVWFHTNFNLSTIFVCLVLLVIVGLIVRSIINDRRKGISLCGGSCGACPMEAGCHKFKHTRSLIKNGGKL